MDLQHQKNGLDFSPADVKRSDKLRATLDQQQQKIGAMSKEYRDQVPMLEKLQEEHDALLQQMDAEDLAVEHQSRRIESLLGRQIAASRAVQGVKNAVRLSAAAIQQPFKAIQARLSAMTKGMGRFSRRIAGLASSALIFNLLSSGLRQMTSYMGTALLSSASLRQALGNLQGAAATAAAPLIQVLTPRPDRAGKCGSNCVRVFGQAGGVPDRQDGILRQGRGQGHERNIQGSERCYKEPGRV
nr:MAG TPA: hypothetical protein [Caudoviricetes sp.]